MGKGKKNPTITPPSGWPTFRFTSNGFERGHILYAEEIEEGVWRMPPVDELFKQEVLYVDCAAFVQVFHHLSGHTLSKLRRGDKLAKCLDEGDDARLGTFMRYLYPLDENGRYPLDLLSSYESKGLWLTRGSDGMLWAMTSSGPRSASSLNEWKGIHEKELYDEAQMKLAEKIDDIASSMIRDSAHIIICRIHLKKYTWTVNKCGIEFHHHT
jgi:hypothetical protein